MKRHVTAFVLSFLLMGCDYNITYPSPVVNVNSTNTNTNSNTNNIDIHDLDGTTPISPPINGSSPPVQVTIPLGAREVAHEVARVNPILIQNSCQDTSGHAAWGFMDLMILTLRQSDLRWGYVGKYGSCTNPSRDSIAFRTTSSDTGAWFVDIIGNHCGPNPQFTWNVVGFDATGKWCQVR